jgi:hypothetical protein
MTSQTILLNHFFAGLINEDRLRFLSQGEDIGMPHTIFSLKIILVKDIVVWHMTIIAMGCFPV